MKTYFIVLFNAWQGGHVYTGASNYYFKSETEASAYAENFVAKSTTFSEYEIREIMPHYE